MTAFAVAIWRNKLMDLMPELRRFQSRDAALNREILQ